MLQLLKICFNTHVLKICQTLVPAISTMCHYTTFLACIRLLGYS